MPERLAAMLRNPSAVSFAVLVLLLVVNLALQPALFSGEVLTSNLMSFTPLVFAALAQGIIVLSGSVDLSIGAVMSFYTVVGATTLSDTNVGWVVLLCIAISVAIGGVNGLLVGFLRLPAFITTFATSGIVLGATILIMPVPGGYVPRFFYKLYRSDVLGFLPMPLVLLAAGLLVWAVVSRTVFYRHIYAVGGAEASAYASGIPVRRVRFLAHLFAGFFVGLAGMCLLMLTAAGEYRSGMAYSLNSIAAVVIGGIAISGGRGNIWGAVIGALILGLLNNVLFFADISSFYQNFFRGLIVILALALGSLTRLRELKEAV